MLSMVLLPLPEWPMIATKSPRSTDSDTPLSTCTCNGPGL